MARPITVLVVDDSALIREVFTHLLSQEPDITVLDTAGDPFDAREKIKLLSPDVLTLDIEMPKMDGLSFLEKIMTLRPMPVVMASSLTQRGAEATIRALEIGAFDYISKPSGANQQEALLALGAELVGKVRAAARANLRQPSPLRSAAAAPLTFTPGTRFHKQLIAIGASTGGVEALRDVLQELPPNCPPVVITQHMPASFTRSFAARLNQLCRIRVWEASDRQPLLPGNAYIAPGGERHLRVEAARGGYATRLVEAAPVSGHRPSVDVLFHSVADAVGADAVGAILTGMGRDGAEGLLAMKQRGARTIGQDKASCVVYGMPQAAAKIGALDTELPLNRITAGLLKFCEQKEH